MSRISGIGTLLLCILYSLSARSAENPAMASVSGKVVNAEGDTFYNSQILLVNADTLETTKLQLKKDGKFDLKNLFPGKYLLVVSDYSQRSCFLPTVTRFQLKTAEAATFRVIMRLDRSRKSCMEPMS